MKRLMQLVIFAAVLVAALTRVDAGLITYDGLTTGRDSFGVLEIDRTYQGYDWGYSETSGLSQARLPQSAVNGWGAQHVSSGSALFPVPVSGDSFAWNVAGPKSLFIDFKTPHDVDSVYLAKFVVSPTYTSNANALQ